MESRTRFRLILSIGIAFIYVFYVSFIICGSHIFISRQCKVERYVYGQTKILAPLQKLETYNAKITFETTLFYVYVCFINI